MKKFCSAFCNKAKLITSKEERDKQEKLRLLAAQSAVSAQDTGQILSWMSWLGWKLQRLHCLEPGKWRVSRWTARPTALWMECRHWSNMYMPVYHVT